MLHAGRVVESENVAVEHEDAQNVYRAFGFGSRDRKRALDAVAAYDRSAKSEIGIKQTPGSCVSTPLPNVGRSVIE